MERSVYKSVYCGLNLAEFCLFKSDVILGYLLKVLALAMLGKVQADFGWLQILLNSEYSRIALQ